MPSFSFFAMSFAYFVVFPVAFWFFASYAPAGVQMMTDIDKYLSFVLTMFLAFGVTFETPVVATESGGRVAASIDKLAAYAKDLSDAYALDAEHTWVVGVGDRAAGLDAIGERVSLEALAEAVPAAVARRLTEQP